MAIYYESLGPDPGFTLEQCTKDLKIHTFLAMTIVRTERGDELFLTLIARHCEYVLDCGAMEYLPQPDA
jgi:hypothetical protein